MISGVLEEQAFPNLPCWLEVMGVVATQYLVIMQLRKAV